MRDTMPKITKQLIDATAAPAKGDIFLWDTLLAGFGVRIQASGRRTYLVRYRTRDADRTQRKMTLCRISDATPDQARTLARDVFMQVAGGADPAGDRKPDRAPSGPTIVELFTARVFAMAERDRSMTREVERVLLKAKHNAADFFGRDRTPASITSDDIVRFVSHHYAKGHRGAADKARSYLAATFEWAIKSANDYTQRYRKDWGVTVNPVAAVAKDPQALVARDRNLSAEEIRLVWQAASDGNAGFCEGVEACLKVMIATGQRVLETLRMCGSEIDLDAKLWVMPLEKTKSRRRSHAVPLPDVIIPTLRQLKKQHGDGPLFPPVRPENRQQHLHVLSVAQAVRRWTRQSDVGIEHFQPRDLRRTWKSRAHEAGLDRFIRDMLQQHTQSDAGTRHYDRANYLPEKREAMTKWNAWLEGVLAEEPEFAMAA